MKKRQQIDEAYCERCRDFFYAVFRKNAKKVSRIEKAMVGLKDCRSVRKHYHGCPKCGDECVTHTTKFFWDD